MVGVVAVILSVVIGLLVVRSEGIFRKLAEHGLAGRLSAEERASAAEIPASHLDDALWDVVRTCARTDETFEKVGETLEVSLLVRHALAVAGAFHHLYHTHPILQEKSSCRPCKTPPPRPLTPPPS